MQTLKVASAMALAASCLSMQAAPIQWGGNGHYYELVTPSSFVSWTDAQADAVSRGGYLVTITSAAEQGFVDSILSSRPYGTTSWLGLYRATPGGNDWTWVSGEPFSYSNWGPGEPNNVATDNIPNSENAVHIMNFSYGLDGQGWNDIPGNYQGGAQGYVTSSYIVESVPEGGATLALLGFGIAGLGALRRKASV